MYFFYIAINKLYFNKLNSINSLISCKKIRLLFYMSGFTGLNFEMDLESLFVSFDVTAQKSH